MFTCLCIRAVHIEILESMSSSSFINTLRRFLCLRGPVKQFRSDRGTNFIGACKELKINTEDSEIQNYLLDHLYIQCTPFISHGRSVGENDRYSQMHS